MKAAQAAPLGIDETIRQLQIVVGAMLCGFVMFGGIAVFIRSTATHALEGSVQTVLLGVVAFLALGCALGYAVLARAIANEYREKALQAKATGETLTVALPPYRRATILRAGLTEAPGLTALMTYFAGGSPYALVFAAGSALLLLATIPTRAAFETFAQRLGE
jgi:hypothetical protein